MPRQSSGAARYPARDRSDPAPAGDLGPMVKPAEIMMRLRGIMQLSDGEIAAAMHAALECDDIDQRWAELDEDEHAQLIKAAGVVTASRVQAWRKRGREMTWLELRALLTGLSIIKAG